MDYHTCCIDISLELCPTHRHTIQPVTSSTHGQYRPTDWSRRQKMPRNGHSHHKHECRILIKSCDSIWLRIPTIMCSHDRNSGTWSSIYKKYEDELQTPEEHHWLTIRIICSPTMYHTAYTLVFRQHCHIQLAHQPHLHTSDISDHISQHRHVLWTLGMHNPNRTPHLVTKYHYDIYWKTPLRLYRDIVYV